MPAGSSQSSRAGVIDQRLIEGSQHPQLSAPLSQMAASIGQFTPSPQDDFPLDAFGRFCHASRCQSLIDVDLELLAHEDGRGTFHPNEYSVPRATPQGPFVSSFEHQNAPLKSRFFDRE